MNNPDILKVPTRLLKLSRSASEGTQVASNLPNRSQQRMPTADPWVEEPKRDFETIDRTFFNADVKYKYEPITEPNSVRLLKLLPGEPSEIIRIELFTAALDSGTEYEALSYSWGIPRMAPSTTGSFRVDIELIFSHHILCDKKQMLVTESLYRLLLQIRHQTKTRILWNDAICINQVDMVEKPKQLMLMGKIYRQAKLVLCWIGPEKKNTRNAF